jgi:SAM-dependent methyltransferase
MACPLCNHKHARPSWVGTTVYRGIKFPYVECRACGTIYCDPMPDDALVAEMYGPLYNAVEPGDCAGFTIEDPKAPQCVVEWLARSEPGLFVDYGCREGELLAEAARLGWRAGGVELDERVARATAQRTGLMVVTPADSALRPGCADVVHLGDVIEHMTRINEHLPAVLRLLRPGGVLLAQGPLEANANLFTWALRLSRALRGARLVESAPLHVLLATSRGQRALFERFGLVEAEYKVSEVAWPAPSHLSACDLKSPRSIALFALRRCSLLVSALRPDAWGNRYFYAGVKPGGAAENSHD